MSDEEWEAYYISQTQDMTFTLEPYLFTGPEAAGITFLASPDLEMDLPDDVYINGVMDSAECPDGEPTGLCNITPQYLLRRVTLPHEVDEVRFGAEIMLAGNRAYIQTGIPPEWREEIHEFYGPWLATKGIELEDVGYAPFPSGQELADIEATVEAMPTYLPPTALPIPTNPVATEVPSE